MSKAKHPTGIRNLKPAVPLLQVGIPSLQTDNWRGGSTARLGTTTERGYGSEWQRKRLRILKRANYVCQCQRCKEDGVIRPAHEVDHIVNLAEGGGKGDDNLQAINRDCHRLKTAAEAARGHRNHPSRKT